jgi:hypothetical protein
MKEKSRVATRMENTKNAQIVSANKNLNNSGSIAKLHSTTKLRGIGGQPPQPTRAAEFTLAETLSISQAIATQINNLAG